MGTHLLMGFCHSLVRWRWRLSQAGLSATHSGLQPGLQDSILQPEVCAPWATPQWGWGHLGALSGKLDPLYGRKLGEYFGFSSVAAEPVVCVCVN